MNVSAECIREQITTLLTAWGMEPEAVRITAEIMVDTDLAGIDSHGVSMLMQYEAMWRQGQLNLQAKPRIVRESPVTAVIDACAGLGHPVSVRAMELAIAKAKATGMGAVSVFNSFHFGAAGYYAALASRQGLIGMVTSSTRLVSVLPTRAAVPMLGTNPIAFAAPATRNRAFLLDMSTSTVAMNKVKVYDLNHKPLPAGWFLDEAGHTILDPAVAMDYLARKANGGLTALGGTEESGSHKGYGLAMMAQILACTLGGGSFSPQRNKTQKQTEPDNIGHFFMAMDPKAFRAPGEFEEDLDTAIDLLHQTPPSDPSKPVLVPGDPEAAARVQRRREGIPVPAALAAKIQAICERSASPYVLRAIDAPPASVAGA
jgi:LDH2 family malate/lactate/ureidoglycolate dehydrogenase